MMLRKASLALALTIVALAAMSAGDTASAFYSGRNPFWWVVTFAYVPL
jgi:hypothetical protein